MEKKGQQVVFKSSKLLENESKSDNQSIIFTQRYVKSSIYFQIIKLSKLFLLGYLKLLCFANFTQRECVCVNMRVGEREGDRDESEKHPLPVSLEARG